MHIRVLTVGRDRQGPIVELAQDYLKRCPWRISMADIPPRRQGSVAQRLEEEAAKLRQQIPNDAPLIVLDERGKDLTSRDLASHIERFQHDGVRSLCFVVGSADGLDPGLTKQAALRLAFGRATWPHRLVKIMLLEQLYRASTILSGHPYHRD